jgi:hypothetical protein
VTTPSQFQFSTDRSRAITSVESIATGRGWCNIVAVTVDDVPDLKVNVFGLWANHGATVASYVTSPPRQGVVLPSSLGVLHSRGRLGRERIAALLGGAPFTIQQDHSQRGLLLEVPADAAAAQVVDVMCTMSESLCDYDLTGRWRLDLYVRT